MLIGSITEYESAPDAGRKTGFKYQNIRFCCDNQNRTCGGSFWRWK